MDDHNEEIPRDGGEDDEGEEIPPLEVYAVALGLAGPTAPSVVGQLAQTQERRGWMLFNLSTQMPWVLHVAEDVHRWLLYLLQQEEVPEAGHPLLHRLLEDLRLGLEAVVADDAATLNDVSRDLMEVEALFLDFAADGERLQRWNAVVDDEGRRNQEFGYARLRARRERHLGLAKDYLLPDAKEYKIHSASAHPSPVGRQKDVYDDVVSYLTHATAELLEHHVARALLAVGEWLGSLSVSVHPFQSPAYEQLCEVNAEFRRQHAVLLPADYPRTAFHKDAPMFPWVSKAP